MIVLVNVDLFVLYVVDTECSKKQNLEYNLNNVSQVKKGIYYNLGQFPSVIYLIMRFIIGIIDAITYTLFSLIHIIVCQFIKYKKMTFILILSCCFISVFFCIVYIFYSVNNHNSINNRQNIKSMKIY